MATISEAELFTIGPDEVTLTFVTRPDVEVTTRVGEVEISTTGPYHVVRACELEPECTYDLAVDGVDPSDLLPATVRTLARPSGRLLATIATANDVHLGETECGSLGEGDQIGPVFAAAAGDPPYPEVMNNAAVDEMIALEPDAVVVKGDLTNVGTDAEYDDFLRVYGRLGDVMHHVRGNHDAMITESIASDRAPFEIELPGVTLAVLDTVVPRSEKGTVSRDQLDWLAELGAATNRPVLVFGHHHPWDPESSTRSESYFGINPDDSEALIAVIAEHDSIAGYFAGHTHRNRVRRFPACRSVPIVEVACTKDYPGAWAEYRVYEGGYTQMVRRIGAPAAMEWTEKTRQMFAGLYRDYALGSVEDRCFTHAF